MRFPFFSLVILSTLLASGCTKPPAAPPPPAAEKPKVEADLLHTTLSAESYKSLGIQSAPVRIQDVQAQLPLTGWIMVRQGNEATLTAPVAGYVRAPVENGTPIAGLTVKQDQQLFLLEPVLGPLEQVQLAALKRGYENELAKARENLLVAEKEQSRVQDLFKQGLRSQQEIEKSRAAFKAAHEDFTAAEDKKQLFDGAGTAQLAPRPIMAPRAGTVLSVVVAPGQYVPAAAPLATVADLSQLWVRVPVPEHYLPQLDRGKPVTVTLRSPDAKPGPSFEAKPLALVPVVDPLKHTADMIYEVAPQRTLLAKDQMVTVALLLGEEHKETVVPYSAVIYDAYGGTWIYLDQGAHDESHVFERMRVELGPSLKDGVVVRPGCKANERVVVAGAAALFSREFHRPPLPKNAAKPKVDDDDD